MQGRLTNRYNRKVRVYIYSQVGSGQYEINANSWIWSGEWQDVPKYMLVYDYHNWTLYGCKIIIPHHDYWYDCVPSAPSTPNPTMDPGTQQFPNPSTGGNTGGGGTGGSGGQNPNPGGGGDGGGGVVT